MASGTIYATIPAIVAAAGIYFFDRNHSKSKERGGGIRAAIDKLVAKAKEEEKTTRAPKFAPQFDGLHCFETLVGR
ncbi:uncharacterized protein LOC132168127 [Corylus avellana]|uniref:uncharacterized protein LOC132168127 n=1 Tax=Corylus avellana TaxID=13451 RepID=UPI001E1EC7A4|nr:uncharacterized protein LOC132168127 [Corylus avellana]